jgi:hypothetical protein
MCEWVAQHADKNVSWMCVLPKNHHGQHLGLVDWETAPYEEDNRVERNGVWVEGDMCHYCNRRHPGFRHANDGDKIVIAANDEDWWGPQPLNPNSSQNGKMGDWREMFVPDCFEPFPTPPKFATIEEADAWLEAHASV